MASETTIQVTLRCSDKLDEYNTRTFTLRPGAVVQIGRASKNSAKPELMIGPGNAYIDSPTISREHAVLTATSPPAPSVYITDKGSMHGTMVNGNKLEPHKSHRLNNGDILNFGANVMRDNLFYTARSFTYESSLPTYPQGISVPDDAETSDEEDVEVDEALSCAPSYGTETNPVTIDDTAEARPKGIQKMPSPSSLIVDDDDFDDDELEKDLNDTTMPLERSEDTQEPSPASSDMNEEVFYPEHVSTTRRALHGWLDDEASSEDDAASGYSIEDDEMSQIGLSLADSDESQSDGDMELEDNEDEENEPPAPTAPRLSRHNSQDYQMQLMLLEQQNKKRLLLARQVQDDAENGNEATESHVAPLENQAQDVQTFMGYTRDMPMSPAPYPPLASSASTDAQKNDAPAPLTSAPPASKDDPPKPSEPVSARTSAFFNDSLFGGMYCGGVDTEMPPRPAAPRLMQYFSDYNSPFQSSMNTMLPPYTVGYSEFDNNCAGPVGALLPNPYAVQHTPASPDNVWASPTNIASPPAPPVSGVQTPPPASSPEVSSPPVRRTEVSIREIVEDTVQQPPTPTSVTGGTKRKAEVLDELVVEEEKEAASEPSLAPKSDAEADTTTVVQDAATQAAESPIVAIDKRPKKRLRSRIGSAVKTAATWMVPGVVGAAASVAFLTSVPNDFFVA